MRCGGSTGDHKGTPLRRARRKHNRDIWRTILSASPDPAWKASNDLRQIGETLVRISRALHEHTRKLEVAVEGTYAHEGADPRVRLLNDSLRVSRVADLELGRLNQAAQRVLLTIQEQLDRSM